MKTEIPLDKIVEFKLKSNNTPLGPETVDEIMKISFDAFQAEKGAFATFPFDKLDRDVEWKWQSDRGSLPKRIESWFYKEYKIKLDPKILSNLGNIARATIPKDQVYYFDITKDFNWKAGDFGDPQSCFFGPSGPEYNPVNMQNSGKFYAIRFFKKMPKNASFTLLDVDKYYEDEDTYYIGISRSWMGDSPKAGSSLKVIFNGYGLTTLQISNIMADYLEAATKKVYIGDTDLYINGDGYVIGDKKDVDKFGDRFNLNFY